MKIRDKEIILWCNKDILFDVEPFHAWTWAFAFLKLLSLAFILYSVAASFPKMSLLKQMKVDKECSLPTQLVRFLFFYGDEWDTRCLVCSQQVLKNYNIRSHYETHHGERYRGLQG